MHDLFLSYSTSESDRKLVRSITESLSRDAGLRIWRFDEEIDLRNRRDDKVKDAIKNAQAVLVLFTREASKSDWVQGELDYAREMSKIIIFCQDRNVTEDAIPIQFKNFDRIKFDTVDDLLERLRIQCRNLLGIPVIIPAAGEGGGLYPISINMPKALIPVGNKPMLHQIIMNIDAAKTFTKVYVLVSAKRFKSMFDYYVDILRPQVAIPIEVVVSKHAHLPMALKMLLADVPIKRTFLLHFSDIVLGDNPDWSWTKMISTHQHSRKIDRKVIATLAVSPYYPLPIGVVKRDDLNPNLIKSFEEKPKEWIEVFNQYVNTAITLLEPEIEMYIEETDRSFYGDCLTRAVQGKECYKVAFDPLRNWRHIQTIGDWWDYQEMSFPIK